MDLRKLLLMTSDELQAIISVIQDDIKHKKKQLNQQALHSYANDELAILEAMLKVLEHILADKKEAKPAAHSLADKKEAKPVAQQPSLQRFVSWLADAPGSHPLKNSVITQLQSMTTLLVQDQLSNLPTPQFHNCLLKIADRIGIGVLQETTPPTLIKDLSAEQTTLLMKTIKFLIVLGALLKAVEEHPNLNLQLQPLIKTVQNDLVLHNGGYAIEDSHKKAKLAAHSFELLLKMSQKRESAPTKIRF